MGVVKLSMLPLSFTRRDMSKITFFFILNLPILFSGCATGDESNLGWDDPVVFEEDAASIKPKIDLNEEEEEPTQDIQAEDELDVSTEPWEPDTSIGSKVYEDDLPFSGDTFEDFSDETLNKNRELEDLNFSKDSEVEKSIKAWVKVKRLDIRERPDAKAKIVGSLKRSEKVFIIRVSNGWAEIGAKQYVPLRYLTRTNP